MFSFLLSISFSFRYSFIFILFFHFICICALHFISFDCIIIFDHIAIHFHFFYSTPSQKLYSLSFYNLPFRLLLLLFHFFLHFFFLRYYCCLLLSPYIVLDETIFILWHAVTAWKIFIFSLLIFASKQCKLRTRRKRRQWIGISSYTIWKLFLNCCIMKMCI